MYRMLLLLLIGSLLFWMSPGAYAQNVPELMYFKFNESGGSTTQNFASAPVGTNPAPVTGQTMGGTGQFGAALIGNGLSGSTNNVNTGWPTALGTGDWTISLWLNNFPATAATTYYFFGDAGGILFRCFTGGVAGNNALLLRGTGLTDVPVTAIGSSPIVIHFVRETSPSSVIKVYRNGVLANTVAQGSPNITGTGFKVGAQSTSNSFPAGCLMDEFRMYNRALDAAEIAATWNQSLPLGTPGWSAQTSGVTTTLRSVKAVSNAVVWAAGASGVVLRTTNGGNAWTSVGGGAIGTTAMIYNVEALDATTAFVTTSPTSAFTHIFRTTNGGTSWDTVFTQTGTDPFINAIHMFDATNGIAEGDPIGGKWTIVRTTNGGASWVRDTVNAPIQVGTEWGASNGMVVLGTTHIWFSPGSGNGFYRSTNGGTTWTRSTLPTAGFYPALDFSNTQYGVVGSQAGTAARTTDGGATWNPVTIGTTGQIWGAGAAGTLDFWATRGTTIQTSNNRGATWTQDFSDATAGTFQHVDFITNGGNAYGWAVTSTGKIFTYFNPVNLHDLGVTSLAKISTLSQPTGVARGGAVDESNLETAGSAANIQVDQLAAGTMITPDGSSLLADTVRFRAIIKNLGTFAEPGYQMGWSVDAVNQTPINRGAIASGASDTVAFQWNQGVEGGHILRAWATLADDGNPSNDTATLAFFVGRAPGDTLYTFVVPGQIILGVAKFRTSNKLAFTSGGQVAGTTTSDNKWIITDLYGTFIDTTHPQVNPTAGQGFGFRDIGWDGNWFLTSDDTRLRRIDTTTFTEVLAPIITQTNPNRGVAVQEPNRIWVSNFTTNPIRVYDTTGVIVRTVGTPPVAPYGLGWDAWTSPNRAWLWYPEPSLTGTNRLSKVDTATGAIVQTFNYTSWLPSTSTVGGMDIVRDHPDYPGAVVGFVVIQNYPTSRVLVIYLGRDSTVVGVGGQGGEVPEKFALLQNYPNPFNPTTNISYALPTEARVTLAIYDVVGREIVRLVNERQGAGVHQHAWDGRNAVGMKVGSGVYFYKMEAQPGKGGAVFTSVKKMLMLK